MIIYILLLILGIILFFIGKQLLKRFKKNRLMFSLESNTIEIPYDNTRHKGLPHFRNFKCVNGVPPYVDFKFKEVYHLVNSDGKTAELLEESTISSGNCFFSSVVCNLGCVLIRCTLFPNRMKIFTFYEVTEIKNKSIVFKKIGCIDNFDSEKNFDTSRFENAMKFIEFVLNYTPYCTSTHPFMLTDKKE